MGKDVTWHGKKFTQQLTNAIMGRMKAVAVNVEAQVIKSISTGQPFRRTKSGGMVGLRPSKPGNPPHALTGRLRQSITHEVFTRKKQVGFRVGTNVEYAKHLELSPEENPQGGGLNRPFLRPAMRSRATKQAMTKYLKGLVK